MPATVVTLPLIPATVFMLEALLTAELILLAFDTALLILVALFATALTLEILPPTALTLPILLATVFVLDNTSATKGCKNAVNLLNKMEEYSTNIDKTKFHQTKPTAFIERYCSRLNLNKELTMVCKFVASKIEKNNLIPENTPHSVAAGIVYFVSQTCNLNVSKKNVNTVSEISEVTINKCYKKLDKIKHELIPGIIIKKSAE